MITSFSIFVFSFSNEQAIVPEVVSLETSNTTTIKGNFTKYTMSSQYLITEIQIYLLSQKLNLKVK